MNPGGKEVKLGHFGASLAGDRLPQIDSFPREIDSLPSRDIVARILPYPSKCLHREELAGGLSKPVHPKATLPSLDLHGPGVPPPIDRPGLVGR